MADKKISELPLITTISGSIVFVPIVHDGITEKMTVDRFSLFTSQFSAHTGSAGNTFKGPQIIESTLSVTGNASIGGNLVVNGKLTAQEIHTEITSASIIFESGSTIFGNSADDTHQFSGSVSINGISIGAAAINDFTASQLANDTRMLYITGALNSFTQSQIGKDGTLAEVTSSLRYFYETTSSLHAFTASQIGKDGTLGLVTSSLNLFTQSQIGKDGTLAEVTSSLRYFYQTTSSLHAFTASQIGKDGTLGLVTSSFNDFTQSQIGKDGTLAEVTSSLRYFYQTTSSLHAFTASQIGKDGTLGLVTSSFNAFTQSQIGKDFTLSIVTSSLNNYTSSVIGQANTIAVFTASINAFTASQIGKDGTLAIVTSSIDAHILKQATQTGSQDLVNYQNSIITSSYRIELNSIEAYTSSLKSAITVNGSNVQIIGELNVNKLNVQYISSSVLLTSGSNVFGDTITDKHEFTGSVNIKDTLFVNGQAIGLGELNAFTGSQIGKDFTLSVVTSSIDAHILKQATQTGSQDLVNYNISVYTGSQNVINTSVNSHILVQSTQTGSQDIVNFNISVVTSSIDSHILKQATQTGSQDLVNLGISTFTGSLRSEVNLIEAYTASLKGAAIVSSSQQITNYYKFAQTASANTFYGDQTITGSLAIKDSETDFLIEGNGFSQTYLTSNGAIILNPGYGGVEMVGSYRTFKATDITADGFVSGEIRATNNVVSSSAQIQNYFTFAQTASANTFYGNQSISGTITATTSTTGAAIKLGGFTNYGTIQDVNDVRRIWFENVGSYRTIFDLPVSGSSFAFRTNEGTSLFNVNSGSGASVGTGDLTITNGNLVMASGKGIDFSATSNGAGTMASELLNDYEEGTWSPQIYYQNATDQTNSTNVTQVGNYTKIGNVVYVSGVLQWTITGSPANDNIGIKNLPFTSKTGADYYNWGLVQLVNAGAYPTDGYVMEMQPNATMMLFYDRRADTGNYGDDIGASGTKTARFSLTYLSA
jgi:hypothetical protein